MSMRIVTDQMGRKVSLPAASRRIVSLVPSQTELLHALGLESEVVGITRFCIHPENWFRNKPRVGGTKDPDLDKIRSLKPDLILGNREENAPDAIHQLEAEFPVWMSDIHTLGDALDMIESIGRLTGTEGEASLIAATIRDRFSQLAYHTAASPRPSVLYFIWKDPWMVAGRGTFIHDMMHQAGWLNRAGHLTRYPEAALQEWSELRPEYVFLSSEPYPFSEKHLETVRSAFPDAKVALVDGEMFSWYGSRLLSAPEYFQSLTRAFMV